MLKELLNARKVRGGLGKLEIYGENGINTDSSREEAAEKARKLNTREVLHKIAYGQEPLFELIHNGYRFAVIKPTSPYTPESRMLIVHDENLNDVDGEPQYIYELPSEIQRIYWGTIAGILDAYSQVYGDEHQILYVENVVPTTDGYRTSRTIDLVHGQPVRLVETRLSETTEKLQDHQQIESAKTFKLLQGVNGPLSRFKDLLDEHRYQDIQIELYQQPAGYAFNFPILENRHELMNLVQRVMELHWNWYKQYAKAKLKAAQYAVGRDDVLYNDTIPGPAYRQIVQITDGQLRIIISPEYMSHAGPMESINILLRRSLEGQTFIDPDQEEVEKEALINAYAATIPPWTS